MPKTTIPVPLTLTWRDESTCCRYCDPVAFRSSYVEESESARERRAAIYRRHGFAFDFDRAVFVHSLGQKGPGRDPAGLHAALTRAGYVVSHEGARVPPGLPTGSGEVVA